MKKKTNRIFPLFFICLLFLFSASCSYMKTDLGNENIDVSITQIKTSSGKTGVILAFNAISSELEIPSSVQGLHVMKISFYKTSNLSSLSSITFDKPCYITEIDTFKGATSLTTIELPDTITVMPSFKNCTKLETVTPSSGITVIPDSCFEGCSSLKTVTIPEKVSKIGDSAFSNTKLKEIMCYPPIPPAISKPGLPEKPKETTTSTDSSSTETTDTTGTTVPTNNSSIEITVYVPADSIDLYKKEWGEVLDLTKVAIKAIEE